jgi:hypothetical protein
MKRPFIEQVRRRLQPFVDATVRCYLDDWSVHDQRELLANEVGTRFIWSCRETGTHLVKIDSPSMTNYQRALNAELVRWIAADPKFKDGSRDWHEIRIASDDRAMIRAVETAQLIAWMEGRKAKYDRLQWADRVKPA